MFISGMPGLHKLVAQSRNGFIAESLTDKKRFHVSNNQQVSMLSDISIFTTAEDVKLVEVFKKMKEKGDEATNIDLNADGALISKAFEQILPDYDKDRVYISDIKKVFKWFNLLKNDVDFLKEEEEQTNAVEATEPANNNIASDTNEEEKPKVKKPRATRKPKNQEPEK